MKAFFSEGVLKLK